MLCVSLEGRRNEQSSKTPKHSCCPKYCLCLKWGGEEYAVISWSLSSKGMRVSLPVTDMFLHFS
ncbi:hypothetical protein X975_20697, partial [Stegodyphus mimosarum]